MLFRFFAYRFPVLSISFIIRSFILAALDIFAQLFSIVNIVFRA